METKIKIPPPSCLNEINAVAGEEIKLKKKQITSLSNVQRRNILTVTEQNPNSMSIHQLAAHGEFILLDKLLKSGQKVDELDDKGLTPLMWACSNRQRDTVELLTYHGADVNMVSDNKDTCLLLAAQGGYKDIMEYLIRCGADVDSCDMFGNTGLMLAAHQNHAECCRLLLEMAADICAQNEESGLTALEIANQRGSDAAGRVIMRWLCEMLQEAYADNEAPA